MTRLRSESFGAPGRLRSGSFGAPGARLRFSAFATVAAVIVGGGSNVFACPACFGAEETSMIDGTRLGVVVLLAVLLVVQGAFAAFFLYLRKRAKEAAEDELEVEWAELQRGSRTS